MKRILLHLAISVLAFGVGLSASALWRLYISVNTPEPFLADISEELPFPLLIREEVGIACGPDSSTTNSHYYYLSNGGEVTRTCHSLSSAAAASKEVQARRHGASDTIDWSLNINSEGQPVGETVLIVESPTIVRLSTNLGRLCETRASSMNDLR